MKNPNDYVEMLPGRLLPALNKIDVPERSIYLIILLMIYVAGGPVKASSRTLAKRFHLSKARTRRSLHLLAKSGLIILHPDGTISVPDAESFILGGLSMPLTLVSDSPVQVN